MIDRKVIQDLAGELLPQLVKCRKHLHQYPELSNEEFKTTEYLEKILGKHKIKTSHLKLKTGLIGLINNKKSPAVAVRTDIDALPITEETGLTYQSKNIGVMHACGHDIHMAVVLGTAILLNKLKSQLPGSIKFIFQPAEEAPPGGAEQMIRAGIMQSPGVKMVFGLHVDPTLPVGKISLRDGPTMASVMDIDITIKGTGGHAALPHRAVDAITVAAEVVESLQKVISRETNPIKPALLTFGVISGGKTRNVIADRVCLSGTARTLDSDNIKLIPKLIKRTVSGICKARGAGYEINILSGYPVLSNHPEANIILKKAFSELYGAKNIKTTPQTMGGEDFSFYLQKAPGAMFRLGIKNPQIGADKSWHSPKFVADEKSILYGTELMSLAVVRYLED